jgi:hypothetical protein
MIAFKTFASKQTSLACAFVAGTTGLLLFHAMSNLYFTPEGMTSDT